MSETARDLVVRVGGAALDLADGLDPILAGEHEAAAALVRHGWTPPAQGALQPLLDALPKPAQRQALRTALEAIRRGDTPDLSALAPLGAAAAKLLSDLRGATAPTGQPAAPFDKPRFWQTFPGELADELLAGYLELHRPELFAALLLAGVITQVRRPAEPAVGRRASAGDELAWSRLPQLLTKPGDLAATVYGWRGDFAHHHLLATGLRAARALGAEARLVAAPSALIASYYAAANPALAGLQALEVPLLRANDPTLGYADVRFLAVPIPERGDKAKPPKGLWLGLEASGAAQASVPLTGAATLRMHGGAAGALPPGFELLPSGPGLSTAAPPSAIDAGVAVELRPDAPWRPFGAAVGTRVELADAVLGLELEGSAAALDLRLRLATSGLKVVVDASEGDGFLHAILPAAPQTLEVSGALLWSSRTGVRFDAQAALELIFPINRSLGPVEVVELLLGLRVGTSTRLALEAGVTVKAALGPLELAVRNVGLRARLVPAADPQALIALDTLGVAVGFKPPAGAGAQLGAGPVKGGGFLDYDEAQAQYGGLVHLEFKALSLTAVGLLTTRLPDGGEGFSLLVIIAGDLPPIQLGWGFTLNGIGGLIGINRSVVVQALQSGLKQGALSSVMFPKDPVANAPKIIRDVATAFPPTRDQFVVGPMVAIGWGTPPILRAELGLVLELPHPLRLLLLGRLMAGLPALDLPVAYLQVDVLGVLDFDAGTLAISAALIDSHIGTFPLTGQFELRAAWGATPTFLLSAGGFHPAYAKPAGFPDVERLALTIFTGENPRLRMEGYFALTTASVQAGARIDAHVHRDTPLGRFSADGHLGFDVVVLFDPFRVSADLGGVVRVQRDGKDLVSAQLELHLSGPGPWHAWGIARFHFLGQREVPLDLTAGEAAPPPAIAPVDPTGKLLAALGDERSWSTAMGEAEQAGVALRGAGDGGAALHPIGRLRVHQRVLPLDLRIDRFGAAPLVAPRRYAIVGAALGATDVAHPPVTDHFAPGQFLTLSEDQKLSRPAFERFDAGVELGSAATKVAGTVVTGAASVATVVIDRVDPAPPTPALTALDATALEQMARLGPAAGGGRRATAAERFGVDGMGVEVDDTRWAVTLEGTLERVGPVAATTAGATCAGAQQAAARGALAVPEHELVAA